MMALEFTEDQLDGDPNNDPECVEYWQVAKEMASRGGSGVLREYAKLAGVTPQEFKELDPEALCERYKFKG
jgi:hypothetical protein